MYILQRVALVSFEEKNYGNSPLGIFIWSKQVHGTIIMCKCLEALKTGLTIMKGCGANVNINIGRLCVPVQFEVVDREGR